MPRFENVSERVGYLREQEFCDFCLPSRGGENSRAVFLFIFFCDAASVSDEVGRIKLDLPPRETSYVLSQLLKKKILPHG